MYSCCASFSSQAKFRLWFAGIKGFCGNISCYTYSDPVRQNVNYISLMVNINNDELTLGQYNADVIIQGLNANLRILKALCFFRGRVFVLFWLIVFTPKCCFKFLFFRCVSCLKYRI